MIRIASMNIQNLFERTKALNGLDGPANQAILDSVGELEAELAKVVYDKAKILKLYNGAKDFIVIREDRGKLFSMSGKTATAVKANGRNDWDGGIEFVKEAFSDKTRGNTARVIADVNADILCLVEVEGRRAIENFAKKLLPELKYTQNMSIKGNDTRGIDVGLLSRHPIGRLESHIFDKNGNSRIFSRDCLVVSLDVNGKPLTLMLNHLKSQGYGDQAANDARRKGQAMRIAELLKVYDLKRELVVVCGDFNDVPTSAALAPLLANPDLYDVLNELPVDQRWTYYYSRTQQIDYILVSSALKKLLQTVGVERRGIYNLNKITKGAQQSYNTVTGPRNAASDHAAIWADFGL